ncbi:hypothetical protein Tco_0885443 [Tanacetum coccineum]
MSLDDASSVAPPSPEYVSDPMELEDHASVYVPEPKYIEYLAPSDDDIPMEDQPLPVEASPVALSPGYIADFDPEEDEEDPKEDPTNYPADGGDDDDDKSSDDDDDDDDEEEDEEHLAHADSTVVAYPAVDLLQHHSLLPTGIPPLLPIPLPAPSTSRKHGILEADMPLRKRLLLTAPTSSYEAGEISAAGATRQPGSIVARMVDNNFVDTTDASSQEREQDFYSQHQDAPEDSAAVRAEIGVLRRERLACEQKCSETRQALARSKAHNRALEARMATMETQLHRMEWQHQDADDHAVRHIMRTQALEAGARIDTLEDTGSSS